ncbi:MAG: methanol--corrinoid protein MtaC [Methanohalobium sp.]|uniref:methanol--corrinoid protein MtaC n=1 Tax=Methanohalobium sp. TaxID=2837493 RepID=UPI0039783C54
MLSLNPKKTSVFVRYNVQNEKKMTPDELAEVLYPKDELVYPIAKAIFEGDEDDVVLHLQEAIEGRKNPIDLINDALIKGMSIVSKLYDDGDLYLPDVIISAQAMIAGVDYCKSISTEDINTKGKIVCFVAEGDIHDIGKNIVAVLLKAKGFDVVDLGRDVPIEEVVEAVLDEKPIMVSGTALMTTTMYSFKKIKEELTRFGMDTPLVCGGGAVTQDFVTRYKLGIYGEEAADVPKIAESILKGENIDNLQNLYHKH